MTARSIYESDLTGDVIPEEDLVTVTIRTPDGQTVISHLSQQELETAMEDSVLNVLVLHD